MFGLPADADVVPDMLPREGDDEQQNRLVAGSGDRTVQMAPCPHCGNAVDRSLPFCPHCGFKTGFATPITRRRLTVPRLAVLDEVGSVVREIPLDREVTIVGRTRGDVLFDDDESLSPEHAALTWRDNALRVRDLGSSNGSWLFISAPQILTDGDVLLIGSQVIRFRTLATRESTHGARRQAALADMPSPEPGELGEEADVTQRLPIDVPAGSRVPKQDAAMLEQLRADGSVRDVLYLSTDRPVLIGREFGDWVFPYDPTISSRHAEIHAAGRGTRGAEQTDDAASGEPAFVVRDVGSRNGIAILVRGERAVRAGERLLIGRKMLRLELS